MNIRLSIVALATLMLFGGCSCMTNEPAATARCTTDAECVPATCCHATACVTKSEAPDCSSAPCTRECRANTIDCGGGCVCRSGGCAVVLNDLGSRSPKATP